MLPPASHITPPSITIYHEKTSNTASFQRPLFISIAACIPIPRNRCITPNTRDHISILVGSSIGLNQIGSIVISLLKMTFAATWKKSPNHPPKSAPQNTVDNPHRKNIFIILYVIPSSENFFNMMKQAAAMTIPYPASLSIIPKNIA